MKTIKYGMLGFGTVGSGFYACLLERKDMIEKRFGVSLELSAIHVRRVEALPTHLQSYHVGQVDEMLEREDIAIIFECINGVEPALTYVKKALTHGKCVISANKAAIAHGWEELSQAIAFEKELLRFEASVGGGIQVVETLKRLSVADEIIEIQGILNGTTNYILTKMSEGKSYSEALDDAQRLGYAEDDPYADVAGVDAVNKLAILSNIAFNTHIRPDTIPRASIESVADVHAFTKVIATSVRDERGICASIAVKTLDHSHPLARIEGVTNAVLIKTKNIGDLVFSGPGAGSLATGTSMVMDIYHWLESHKKGE